MNRNQSGVVFIFVL